MTGPGVQRLADAVVIQGAAVADLAYLVTLGLRYRTQVDGCAPSEPHRRLLAMLTDASLVPTADASGRADVRKPVPPAGWVSVDSVGSEMAGRMLGITGRQVRRVASEMGGRRVKGSWRFERAAVSAAAARRSEGNPDG